MSGSIFSSKYVWTRPWIAVVIVGRQTYSGCTPDMIPISQSLDDSRVLDSSHPETEMHVLMTFLLRNSRQFLLDVSLKVTMTLL
jgi:hypothetical protein